MITIVVTAVYPIFFLSYAAAGLPGEVATFRHGIATTIGLAIIAVLAPFPASSASSALLILSKTLSSPPDRR